MTTGTGAVGLNLATANRVFIVYVFPTFTCTEMVTNVPSHVQRAAMEPLSGEPSCSPRATHRSGTACTCHSLRGGPDGRAGEFVLRRVQSFHANASKDMKALQDTKLERANLVEKR